MFHGREDQGYFHFLLGEACSVTQCQFRRGTSECGRFAHGGHYKILAYILKLDLNVGVPASLQCFKGPAVQI